MAGSISDSKEGQFYHKLRQTVRIWAGGKESRANRYADFILASPDLFMLLVQLSRDDRVSQINKARMAGATAYFVSPLDLVPELLLGPAGLIDDVALSAYVLHELLETTDPSVVREHWAGNADILDLIRQILAAADSMVGGPVWRRLIARAESFIPVL
ncbi:YkvA family protein [Chloroflexota bacterium]